jgi:hypothetical protein
MADIVGNITKGPLLYYLDQLSRSDASLSRLGALLAALEQLQPTYRGLVDVFQQHLFLDYDPARMEALNNYLRRYWFDEVQGWWRPQQPIEPVFCQGLIKALREAIDNPITVEDPAQGKRLKALPIDSYWIVVGERFEMTICRSLQQVTLLILTPNPPIPRPGIWDQDTPIWVVRRETTATAPHQAGQSAVGATVEEGQVERDQVEGVQTVTNRVITVRVRHRTSNR